MICNVSGLGLFGCEYVQFHLIIGVFIAKI